MLECLSCYLYLIIALFTAYAGWKIFSILNWARICNQFNNIERDTIVLHVFPRLSVPLPGIVPWDLKIEMFCRMANIKYEKDYVNSFGPKGKTPWISINGTHMGDSHLILEFLRRKFNVDFNKSYTKEQLAVARSVRVMLEERWYWAMVMWRWLRKNGVEQFYKDFARMQRESTIPLWIIRIYFRYVLRKQVVGHGIGLHSEEEVMEMHLGDLRAVSAILGNKKYILGDEPCEDDCAIFGQLAQAVWGLPNSPFEKLMEEETPNLKEYVQRVKDTYWPNVIWEP